jgi:hypothetical protein
MIDETAIERELRAAAARADEHPLPDLGEAAATAGLLDVAYATLDSPLGTLLLARTDRRPRCGSRTSTSRARTR